ncbi:methyl-accepting chemotaxis protein [Fimbriiglobus ruber]|uniref:Methyl-accepting chemotaxis protein I (Serine chemoreceptor protein) n=1 Tax=Fimbriiglobus ruber TaxID=1908690 RepID=A0A225DF63_9BACT|nr:methyl-accepting chemotaxis protein [Fimbriiglobus ruber]OWK34737.1 Methyl-accepting chemotaxis protein I (serine chemoreceptor protein) [Fimbriiglobus ruber]
MGGLRFGFRGKLFSLIGLFAAGLVVTSVIQSIALNTVKIKGPLYDKIQVEQDLQNSLDPPVLFIREPYLATLELGHETDPNRQRDLVSRYRRAEQEYQEKYAEWSRRLPEGKIKETLRSEAHAPAVEFFEVANREFLPAVLEGGAATGKAQGILKGRLRDLYKQQKAGTEKVKVLAIESVDRFAAEADETVHFWNRVLVIVGATVLVVLTAAGWWISRGIVEPTNELIARMEDMSAGATDLTARVQVRTHDEIGRLATAINTVVHRIHDLVVKVRESSIQLYASSTEIAATARQQEATMQNLGTSTNQIAAAVKEITATSRELAQTMNAVNDGGKQAGSLAEAGRAGLSGMKSTMQRLAESTGSISAKLGVVREKAHDINAVVTTITKVADQTNLLSINAAIEAEKAGEYGRGFLVVAREIRRLADQTAVATLDIENMVRQMQGAVSAGVMEMDKFTDEVRSGVARVSEINTQMGQIIEQVHALNDRFQAVNEGMGQQSAGASQINEAMLQLAAGVEQTSAALKEFHAATGNLHASADVLKSQVSQFTVAG